MWINYVFNDEFSFLFSFWRVMTYVHELIQEIEIFGETDTLLFPWCMIIEKVTVVSFKIKDISAAF